MIISTETADMAILAAPVAVVVLAVLTYLLLLFKRHRAALVVGVLTLSLNSLTEQIPVRMKKDVPAEKPAGTIRIFEYNICAKEEYHKLHGQEFIDYVLSSDADVLFLPENTGGVSPELEEALKPAYPYSIHDYINTEARHLYYADFTLYSRYPLSHFKHYQLPRQDVYANHSYLDSLEIMRQCDIMAFEAEADIHGQPVTLLHLHLRSNSYDAAKEEADTKRQKAHNVYDNLMLGYAFRAEEARVIVDSLRNCPNPLIICGDFNDISGSRCVREIQNCRANNVDPSHRDRLNNAWWCGGQGFGFSYVDQHLWLRLDHILYSKEFELQAISIPQVPYSDHRPLVADFCLKPLSLEQ